MLCSHLGKFNSLMTDNFARIKKARLYIFSFQPRISFKDGFRTVSGSQHGQDMLDRQAAIPNNCFPTENFGVDRYPLQDLFVVHESLL